MEDFLLAPQSAAGQQFVATGSCALPAPDADPTMLADDAPLPPPLHDGGPLAQACHTNKMSW